MPEAASPEEVARAVRTEAPGLRLRRTGRRLRLSADDAERLEGLASLELDWSPSARVAVDRRRSVWGIAEEVVARSHELQETGIEAARRAVGTRVTRLPLDEHQVVNLAVMTIPGSWGACVFDEQGTGKTVTMIAAFDVLVERGEADTLLVVAPKTMVGEWRQEFARFTGDLYDVAVVDGATPDRAAALHGGADVVVIGYEAAVRHEDDLVLLAGRRKLVLVVDESYNVKNPDALRSTAVRRLREHCERCYVLCGTPAPNRPSDVVAQFDLVDLGFAFGDYQPSGDDPAQEREEIRTAMESRGVYTRSLKSRVLPELPDRQLDEVEIELAPEQRRLYEAALEDLVVDLEATDDEEYGRRVASFLERRSTLLRICSNPLPLAPEYEETPAKLLALDKILDQLGADGEKVVVWSFFRASLEAIAARYTDLGLVRIDGSVTDVAARREAVRRFQEDDETRIFLGNPAAAGAGITLHRARTAVYESLSNQAAHWMQSLDRIHRRGQRRETRYMVLTCRGTVEETEFARLREKSLAQGDLLGDPRSGAPSRRMLLDELLRT